MNASILAVFEACAAASGHSFRRPERGTVTKCPFHDDRTASLSIRESHGTFVCFSAACIASRDSRDIPGHGIIDAPIAFGLAKDRTESSRWLSERRLIPPSDSSRATQQAGPRVAPRLYTDREALTLEQNGFRTTALVELQDEIGFLRLRVVRDYIAELRLLRQEQQIRAAGELARWLAYGFAVERGFIKPELTGAVVTYTGAKDPDEYVRTFGAEAFQARLDEAVPDVEWIIARRIREITERFSDSSLVLFDAYELASSALATAFSDLARQTA